MVRFLGQHGVETAIAIRDARPGDGPALAELIADLGFEKRVARAAAAVASLGAGERVIVSEADGAVQGFASAAVVPFFHDGSRRLRLTALVVSQSYRRRGLARSLVAELERWGREQGCDVLEVTSAERRADAHAAYRALGFEEAPRRFTRRL